MPQSGEQEVAEAKASLLKKRITDRIGMIEPLALDCFEGSSAGD